MRLSFLLLGSIGVFKCSNLKKSIDAQQDYGYEASCLTPSIGRVVEISRVIPGSKALVIPYSVDSSQRKET